MKKKRFDLNLLHDFLSSQMLTMKLSFVLTFFVVLSASANVNLSTQKVSLNFTNTNLSEVFRSIKQQTGQRIIYSADKFNPSRMKVSINIKDAELSEALDKLLEGLPCTYVINGKAIVITPVSEEVQQVPQNKIINGKVLDESQQPLIGVSVFVEGTTDGVATDVNGEFTLSSPQPKGAVLRFSYIGMKEVVVVFTNQEVINVVMEDIVFQMEDFVVTGYQTISRERSAGSFTSVKGEKLADRMALSGSILQSIEGLSPGLSVNLGEGEEKFTLRGITSLNAKTSPLYVVDGIPMSLDNVEMMVNENDITNVTILKDATAASIWGAQAANGVIVITTNKGSDTDKKVKISYDGSIAMRGMPDYDYFDYMSSNMLIKNAVETFDPQTYPWITSTTQTMGTGANHPIVLPHELPMYQALNGDISNAKRDQMLSEMAARNNRSQIEKYLMSQNYFTRHNLNFLGGSKNHSYYGSLSYEHNQDNIRDKVDKYALNFRQDFRLTPWLSLDMITNVVFKNHDNALQASNTHLDSLLPYMMLKDGQGNNLSHIDLIMHENYRLNAERKSQLTLNYVPLDEIRNGFDKCNSLNLRLNVGLEAKLMEGFKYEGRFAYQRDNSKTEQFYGADSYTTRSELMQFTTIGSSGQPVYHLPTNGGQYTQNNVYENNWTIRNQFIFNRTFGDDKHCINALGGMEIQSNRSNVSVSNIRGYDPQSMTSTNYNALFLSTLGSVIGVLPQHQSTAGLGNQLQTPPFKTSETEYRFVSLYSNAAYTYLSKYSVNGSIRIDQSNLFGTDSSVRYKPIWSAGFSWNIGREKAMENIDFLDRLNLRISYGLGGNSPNPGQGGAYNVLLANSSTLFDKLGYTILYPANKLLRWERTGTMNLGIDFALFDSVLSGSIDVYNKYTKDLLSDALMNPVTGWFSALSNMGEMSNRGVELSLSSRNVLTQNFLWTTSFALSYNKNKIEKLSVIDPLTVSDAPQSRYRQGYAANSIFAYRWAGLDEKGNPQLYDSDGKTKVSELSKLSGPSAVKYMGTSQPPWFGSLTNSFTYKDFELSFMFIFNLGHKLRNDVNTFYNGRITKNLHKDFDNRWRQPGDENKTNVPAYIASTVKDNTLRGWMYSKSDINVLSASYIKLRDLTFAYLLPQSLCNKISAESVKIRCQAGNLFYWAANGQGIDPEAFNNFYGTRNSRYKATWSLGLSINFK